ncbi:MAG: NAD-dependent epimerase/dehydratase family protein [Pirellulales bacterium]|nr:NAD-dependent epimerase/dehydratase family protein [Pirellulales bacterium]
MSKHTPNVGKSDSRPVALVTGATGAVGPTVVRRLLENGYDVRTLVLPDEPADAIPEKAIPFRGDINDRSVLREALLGVDVVFHLAAKLHINDPHPSLQPEYRRVNVEGTRCVAETAADAGVKRFVHFSTINVYGPSTFPHVFKETSPLNCNSYYTETKHESEQIALDRLPTTVLRMGAIYGPRMKGNYTRLLAALRKRRYISIGSGRNRRTLVHQEDVARAAILAASDPRAIGQIYNVSDGVIHTVNEIVTAMCHALARRAPVIRMPAVVARTCAATVDLGLRGLGRRPFAKTTVNKILEDMAVDASKIQSQLGYRAGYDLQRGWLTMVS